MLQLCIIFNAERELAVVYNKNIEGKAPQNMISQS